jgi:hypothetical protein
VGLLEMVHARENANSTRISPGRDNANDPTSVSVPHGFDICVDDITPSLDRRVSACFKASWSWLISCGVHALIALVLMVGTTSPEVITPESIHFSQSPELDADVIQPVNLDKASFHAVGSPKPSGRVDSFAASDALEALASAVAPPDSGTGRTGGGGSSRFGGPTETASTLVESREDLLSEVGQHSKGTRFFGIEATGKRFVFVVDSSGSMKWAKWRRACRELVASIKSLGPDQSFCVFFFDSEPHLMFNQRPAEVQLIAATPRNITRVRRWMASVSFGNETRPLAAVRHALSLRPDAVFLLSDGEFHDSTLTYFRTSNLPQTEGASSRPVVVHTIGFKTRLGQLTLREIADYTDGTYRFVP